MVCDEEKIEELFATWLAQNAPSAHLSELYLCYSEIEAYCLKTKVLRKPLFETTDLDTVKRAQKTVTESRIFQLSHKKQMRKIVAAAQYYTAFVKSLTTNVANAAEKNISQNIPNVSLEKGLTEAAQKNESTSIENKGKENSLQIDFLHINSLAYTKPLSFTYFGDEHAGISNWTQLYVKVLVCLSEDYPDEFLQMYNTNISGGYRIDFGTQKVAEGMNAPKRVSDNFYVETYLSATDIVSKIRLLLDRCNVDYENLEICYTKIRPTQQAESMSIENAQMPTASEAKTMMSTAVTVGAVSYKDSFRKWLILDQHMAERSAQTDAGVIVLGNIDASRFDINCNMVEHISSVFGESATLDRFHGFIPGWEIPRMNSSMIANGWAINTEYFAEVMHALREDLTQSSLVDDCLDVPKGADQRDLTAIKRLCTAFVKLLYPHAKSKEDIDPKEFIEYCLEPAKEMRAVIKKQLCIIDPKEFNVPEKNTIPDIQYNY